jgi:GTP-binding protein
VTEQDSKLLGMIQDSGKSVIIAVNKWDSIEKEEADRVKSELNRKFSFIDYAEYHYISALNGIGINNLFKKINAIKKSTDINFTTSHLTKMMEEAVLKHPPKIINGRRIKLRYMHLGTTDPIRLIIHGNQTKSIPSSYKKYLSKALGKSLNLLATPVLIEFKNSDNPFKGKKNILSKRQINKRRRLIKYNKK